MERGRGCPLTSLEPRTSVRALVLGEGFLGELARVLDLVEGFLGELKLVFELVEGFLEELKLVLVIVKFFCLLDQQLWLGRSLEEGRVASKKFGYFLTDHSIQQAVSAVIIQNPARVPIGISLLPHSAPNLCILMP